MINKKFKSTKIRGALVNKASSMASKLTEKLKVGKSVWENYVAESQKLYCIDLNMRVNNSVLESGSPSITVGENNQSIVYQVIRNDENPMNGLTAKNPTRGMTIEGHIISGSRNKGSQFISTTTDINIANK